MAKTTLFDLFGDFSGVWPVRLIQETVGLIATGAPNPAAWLGALNNGVDLADVRTGAVGDRVSVEARLTIDSARTGYPDGFPFVLSSMPDVEFRIQDIGGAKSVRLFASVSERGAEVVLEGLPVEIRLPAELIEPHPQPDDHPSGIAEIEVGDFQVGDEGPTLPGNLDDLKIVYRRGNPTSIFVHIRLHVTEEGEITVRPAVPISFGKCLFSGLPCLAVHDFSLIPSPSLVPQDVEWIRHTVEPWLPELSGPLDGLFAVRSIHFDVNEAPFKDAAEWLNSHSENEPTAEFVLDDLVVPFYSPYVLPIPRHVTTGIRRHILDPTSLEAVYSFDKSPVRAYLQRDPAIAFIVESLFYRSLPSEDLSEDLGLTLLAGFVFSDETTPEGDGAPKIDQHALLIGWGENYTLRLGYRREFNTTDGLPDPGSGAAKLINDLLHWEIATIVIDIMGFQLGYSLGRAIGEGASFGDSAEATADLFVYIPPTGGEDSFFKLRALNGEKVAFAIEGLGWRQGSFHMEGLALPDGVVAIIVDQYKVILQEVGLLAEQGASYFSISGGLVVELPSGSKGGATVRRLRFRVAGNEDAPTPKLDGLFVLFEWAGVVYVDAGGYYTETTLGETSVREFGLTGSVQFELSAVEYLFGLDLIIGRVKSPAEDFDYFMFQIFFRGSVTLAWFELRGARVLFARSMQPKLAPVDRESQDLRYYNWYKSSNPVNVPGDRRLAAWQPEQTAWALGLGVSASIAGIGKVLELGVFVLIVNGEDENGLLIVGEVLAFKNPTPLGYFALEWDGKNDRFSLVIGVDLRVKNFLDSVPNWINKMGQLTGTLFISNDPGTFAIGKLADQQTWLSLRFDIDLWLKAFILFGFCFEYVDGPEGAKGAGLVVRIEGGINAGIVRVSYNAGFGFMVLAFQTGSSDYAVVIWIEAGLRIVLFGFLRFGISAGADFRVVGSHPSRGEMRAQLRLETPWFLPDVTWTFEIVFGNLEPASLATSVTPLRTAGAVEGLSQKSLPVHIERFDLSWNGEGTAPTFSINQLRAGGSSEAQRLARFEANAELRPVATDSTIGIEWSVAVNDQLSLGGGVAPNLGNQSSGDLTLTYDLIGIRVRRRARFGPDHSWHMLEERIELEADFSDPGGVDLSGSFDPQQLTKFWDVDVQIGGKPATKKLLLNGVAPFEFQTKNPEVDEELVDDNPHWPCCDPGDERRPHYKIHEVIFRDEPVGIDLDAPRLFTESQSRLTFLRPAYVRPHQFGTLISSGALVAFVAPGLAGPIFRAELDEEAAFCLVRLAWRQSWGTLVLLAFDALGDVVASKTLSLGSGSDFQNILLPGQGPIRRLEARIVANKNIFSDIEGQPGRPLAALEVDRVAYVGLRPYLDNLRFLDGCDDAGGDFGQAYEGKGKLFFLPNHDYEIALTTRITVAHPSQPAEPAEVTEYVYFKTKGLPGLNAVERVGEEIEPYVRSQYTGGRGVLYREEPVALAFKEDFSIAVPLALRPPGTSDEQTTLLRMQLLIRPDTAPTKNTPFTATGDDWIVANRSLVGEVVLLDWYSLATAALTRGSAMTSTNPFRLRLAALTQRPEVACPLGDPRDVIGPVLIAPPQGATDPDDPSKQLWPATARFTAAVRPEASGFVDRRGFQPADKTAFDFALDAAAGGSGAWSVVETELWVSGTGRHFAIFGEPTWNHLSIQVSLKLTGAAAGIGVALPAGNVPSRGLFAVVRKVGAGLGLAVFRRTSGVQFVEIGATPLPEPADATTPVTLRVTAFDDILRVAVGETSLDVQRNELREGRLSLVAQDRAQFTSLQVQGLDMYGFPFSVSRFASFEDHIESFNGVLDELAPDALGPGTTTSTVGALWTATQADLQAAMQPDGEPATRQALFERWTGELGLPLKDEVNMLELSRFLVAGQTELFLIESPEPLDFSEEITLALSKRVKMSGPWVVADPLSPHAEIAEALLPGSAGASGFGRRFSESVEDSGRVERLERVRAARRGLRAGLVLAENIAGEGAPALESRPGPGEAGRGEALIREAVRQGRGLHLELDGPALAARGLDAGRLVFAEAVGSGPDRHLKFYVGSVEKKSGGRRVVVKARETDDLRVAEAGSSVLVSEALAGLEPGQVVMLPPNLDDILDWYLPHFVYKPVQVQVLQDGTGRRALIIPIDGSGTKPQGGGVYRLTFDLDRTRWQTSDPPDDLNRYQQTATLRLAL